MSNRRDAIKRLIAHPATPDGERAAAVRALERIKDTPITGIGRNWSESVFDRWRRVRPDIRSWKRRHEMGLP